MNASADTPGPKTSAGKQRAEIFTPDQGGYRKTGYGGLTDRMAKPRPADTSRAGQSKAMAETVVGSLVDQLTKKAQARGGYLTVQDLQTMNKEFQEKAVALQSVFERSFEDYVKARERSSWDQSRNFPFDRLIVKKFSYLFAEGKALMTARNTLSRRMLPGFFMAVNMMMGPDATEDYQKKCRKIVDAVRAKRGKAFTWDDAYKNAEANKVVQDAMVIIALQFENLEKRSIWFIDLVNNHLAPTGEGDPDTLWQMSQGAFMRFFDALLSDLMASMETEGGRMDITRRHGVEACVDLADQAKRVKEFLKSGKRAL
ncbi:MAG TPA: hypothetical protein ENI55_05070 [Alphaproteobacteria bacterium]|nr:hypothetical protein [Alphaproteobacteria bacterium]